MEYSCSVYTKNCPKTKEELQILRDIPGAISTKIADWDGDGKLDLLVNSTSADFYRQVKSSDGKWSFRNEGPLVKQNIEGHDVSPAVVDFRGDGIPDFLGGAEDGHFYFLSNPRHR